MGERARSYAAVRMCESTVLHALTGRIGMCACELACICEVMCSCAVERLCARVTVCPSVRPPAAHGCVRTCQVLLSGGFSRESDWQV